MKRTILVSLLVLFLVSCSSVMLTGRKQLNLVSDNEVMTMSFSQYKSFIDTVPVVATGTNAMMVKRVGARIAKAVEKYMKANGYTSQIENFRWEFNLVKGKQANAFCMPGGKVAVFQGILPYTQNETGIAVVLGHEVAHAIARHSNERLSQQMAIQYGASITGVLLSNKSLATQQGIGRLYGLGTQVGVALPNSRRQELEADRLGLIFMSMAGYNPKEAIPFWQRMSAKGSNGSDFLSTHPNDQKRISEIKKHLSESLKYYKK